MASPSVGHMVDLALRGVSPDLTATECGWQFSLPAASSRPARARLKGDWLEIAAPIQELEPDGGWDPWTLLQLNSRLDGPVRLAADANLSRWLHADMPVAVEGRRGEDDLGFRVQALCGHIRSAVTTVAGDVPYRSAEGGPHAVTLDEVTRLAEEAGWSCARRDGTVEVALDSGRSTHRARSKVTPEGRLQTTVALESAARFTPVVRSACGLLLLRASASVHAVKGIVSEQQGQPILGVAAACDTPRSAADVDRLLTALGVACGLVWRETRALTDEGIARDYLDWQQRHAPLHSRIASVPVKHVDNHSYEKEEEPCLQLP